MMLNIQMSKTHLPYLLGMWVSCFLDCFLLFGSNGIFRRPWENLDNDQVLGELAVYQQQQQQQSW